MTDVPRLSRVVYEKERNAGRNTTLYTLFQKTCKIVTLWNFCKQLRIDYFDRSSSCNVKEDFFHTRKKPNKLIIKQETYFVCESKVCLNIFSAKVFRILSIRF